MRGWEGAVSVVGDVRAGFASVVGVVGERGVGDGLLKRTWILARRFWGREEM